MEQLLISLSRDFPHLAFVQSTTFSWSSKAQEVFYSIDASDTTAVWSLLHETGHALLQHSTYHLDFELLQIELEAWQKAKELAEKYGCKIDDDHMEDCLDSYRDWLHKRSVCPSCGTQSVQQNPSEYRCFNCSGTWQVASSRFCRPYRHTRDDKKSPIVGDFLH